VLFINGIPIILNETKSPTEKDPMREARAQVRRYHDEIPELTRAIQVMGLSDGIQSKFDPTWNLDRRNIHRWKADDIIDLEKLVKDFLPEAGYFDFWRTTCSFTPEMRNFTSSFSTSIS
jgi:type I site-specific restriction-modification system R (restriction) subunit